MKIHEVSIASGIKIGLWLAPTGEIIRVRDNHVSDIQKHGERLGQEGEAREELIKLVLQRGWVRIRNYLNYWSVTVDSLTPNVRANIRNWVQKMMQDEVMSKYSDIKIYQARSDRMKTSDAIDIVDQYALEEQVKESVFSDFAQQPDLPLLTEVKLSRVYNIFVSPLFAVGIISAFRQDPELTYEDNVRNNRGLASTLKSAGFGYAWVDGSWIENSGTDSEVHVSEVSILVTSDEHNQSRLFDELKAGAQKYNQDAFVFQSAGDKEPINIYNPAGEILQSFSDVRLDTIGDVYTKLRSGSHSGRGFVFEKVRSPVGFAGRLAGIKD